MGRSGRRNPVTFVALAARDRNLVCLRQRKESLAVHERIGTGEAHGQEQSERHAGPQRTSAVVALKTFESQKFAGRERR